jgi:hypothetical protein
MTENTVQHANPEPLENKYRIEDWGSTNTDKLLDLSILAATARDALLNHGGSMSEIKQGEIAGLVSTIAWSLPEIIERMDKEEKRASAKKQ